MFKNGVNSIKVGAEAGKWNSYTKPLPTHETPAVLNPNESYKDLKEMGLDGPVFAMEKLPS